MVVKTISHAVNCLKVAGCPLGYAYNNLPFSKTAAMVK